MKRIFLFLIVLQFPFVSFGKDIRVSVKGMVCGFCAQGITKKFKVRDEVESVDVSLEKKTVVVKTKKDKDVSDQVITDILTESGYTIEKIER